MRSDTRATPARAAACKRLGEGGGVPTSLLSDGKHQPTSSANGSERRTHDPGASPVKRAKRVRQTIVDSAGPVQRKWSKISCTPMDREVGASSRIWQSSEDGKTTSPRWGTWSSNGEAGPAMAERQGARRTEQREGGGHGPHRGDASQTQTISAGEVPCTN